MLAPRAPLSALLLSGLLGAASLLGGCARGGSLSLPGGTTDPGDGDGDPGMPIDPDTGPTAFVRQAGLTAAAAGVGAIRVHFTEPHPDEELALFLSDDDALVYAGAPYAAPLAGTSLAIPGLTDGLPQFVGLGVRPTGSMDDFVPIGVVLTATPGPVLYVNPAADPAVANGLTPQTAFPNPISAFLTAFVNGGGNLWLMEGDYDVAFIPQFAGVHAYGGFDASFDLGTRNPVDGVTVWNVLATGIGVDIQGTSPPAILDGIRFDGSAGARVGIDVTDTAIQLRSVIVENFLDRGIRLDNGLPDCLDVVIANCSSSRNGGDGLNGLGAFDFFVDGSTFDANVQEGFDLDDLVAPGGGSVTLQVSGSRFFGNGTQGLDADLGTALVPGPIPGRFNVRIQSCAFERNGLEGCLIDFDFELAPGWEADVTVRECLARANRLHGFAFDADAPGSIFAHRLRSSGNAGDGIHITSETQVGLVIVSSSVMAGNLGAGVRALGPPATAGNRAFALSHCVVTGNAEAGLVSRDVLSSVTSSILHLQPAPLSSVSATATRIAEESGDVGLVNVPVEYLRVDAQTDVTLTLSTTPSLIPGDTVELADDDVARTVALLNGPLVDLDAAPTSLSLPASLGVFAGKDVVEDYRLFPSSTGTGEAMAPPGAPPRDLGIFGSPSAGPAGFGDRTPGVLFYPELVTPPPHQGVLANGTIEVRFSDTISSASLAPAEVEVQDQFGNVLAGHSLLALGNVLVVSPPLGGWPAGPIDLRLHAGISATNGTPNAAPLSLRFNVL